MFYRLDTFSPTTVIVFGASIVDAALLWDFEGRTDMARETLRILPCSFDNLPAFAPPVSSSKGWQGRREVNRERLMCVIPLLQAQGQERCKLRLI